MSVLQSAHRIRRKPPLMQVGTSECLTGEREARRATQPEGRAGKWLEPDSRNPRIRAKAMRKGVLGPRGPSG